MAFGDLTTLGDVKGWLQTGQAAFPATDDALLTRLVSAASQYIQTWLNRKIASADYLEMRDGTGGHRLQFACFPVTAVLSLTIDGQAVPAATQFNAAGYRFSSTQLSVRGYRFNRGAQNIVVAYKAGYSTTPPKSHRHALNSSRCATESVLASANYRDPWAVRRPSRTHKRT